MIKKLIFSILLLFSINSTAQSQYFQNYWLVNSDTLYPYNSNAILKFGNAIFNNVSLNGTLTTSGNITAPNISITGLTNGYIPYVSSGLLTNSPIYVSGSYVGIGTVYPSNPVDIRGKLYINNYSSTQPWVTAMTISVNNSGITDAIDASPNRSMRFLQWSSGTGGYGTGISWGMAPQSNGTWKSGAYSTAQFLLFYTGDVLALQGSNQNGTTPTTFTPTDFVRVLGNGNVLINTTSDNSNKLQVNGSVWINGSISTNIVNASANYIPNINNQAIFMSSSTAPDTVFLPTASGIAGRIYTIKKIDASTNAVVVKGNASELIDGSNVATLPNQYSTIVIQSNGTQWYIISKI